MSRTKTIVISGFLGSGKTTLINNIIKGEEYLGERILIFLGEKGEQELVIPKEIEERISVIELKKDEDISSSIIISQLDMRSPDLVIFEQNGMKSLDQLTRKLEGKPLLSRLRIVKVVNTIDTRTYEMFSNIMREDATQHAINSDIALLNFADEVDKEGQVRIIEMLVSMSNDIKVVTDLGKNSIVERRRKKFHIASILMVITIVGMIGTFLVVTNTDLPMSKIQVFSMVLMSIIMQAFPFLLTATFISAIIQIFITEEMFVKFFPKTKFFSFVVAIISGLFLPICDCATVPVAARLIKKGVPISATVTFMLSAPIINPITIAATLYAFPGQPKVMFLRLLIGVLIALLVGIAWLLFPEKNEVTLETSQNSGCDCSFCKNEDVESARKIGKLRSVFMHVENEFFNVGRFLIVGAMISSLIQTTVPKEWLLGFANSPMASVGIMMTAAFLMSVCSSADAFIARSFSAIIPMQGIISFMVIGPMLDLKNILMMSGYFTRRFIIKTAIFTTGIGFTLLYIITNLVYGG